LRYNLLLIEGSAPSLNGASVSALSEEGFEVATCSDPLMVLVKLGELKPDLIMLGEGLPVDSFEACYRLRRAVDVPVLMLGSIPRADGWVKAIKSGADCYLEKPVSCSALIARMKSILRRCEWDLEQG